MGALSGAVGTYSANGPELEAAVLKRLGLAREDVSTQVVPRDRHAELLEAIASRAPGWSASPPRSATSSAPRCARSRSRSAPAPRRARRRCRTSATRSCASASSGIARLLRGYAQAGLENVALWHERDISHSSVERVVLPDATILLDYAQHLAVRVVDGMVVHEDRMRANLEVTHGALFSQRALLALVESGRSRDEAYRIVQENAQRAWETGTHFRELLAGAAPGARPRRGVRPAGVRAPRAERSSGGSTGSRR